MEDNEKHVIIEIASKEIRIMVGFVLEGKVHVISLMKEKCSGVHNGMINDEDEVSNTLINLIEKTETFCKMKIDSCSLIIPPLALTSINNSGKTCTISNNGVSSIDIQNAIKIAENVNLSGDLTIIDTIPLSYILDEKVDEVYKLPPLNRPAKQVMVQVLVYAMSNKILQEFKNVVFKANIKINNLISAPLAIANYFSLIDNFPHDYFILNIGSELTNFAFIKDNIKIIDNSCYRFGSNYINDIFTKKFSLNDNLAEKYKLIYGLDENPSFPFKLENGVTLSMMKKEIIEAMENSILSKIFKEIETISKSENNMMYLYLVGGGAKLKGLCSYFKDHNIDALYPEINVIGAHDISYVTLLGGIVYSSKKGVKKTEEKKPNIGLARVK